MVNHINQHANKHIVTIECPIEFLYRDLSSSIAQREVGSDVDSFLAGLRAALRQDPDVIMIGELRDHPTADVALEAAVGNVVVAMMNAPDARGTLTRFQIGRAHV